MLVRIMQLIVIALLCHGGARGALPALFDQAVAAEPQGYQFAVNAGAQFLPTSDGKSFYVLWLPASSDPAAPPPVIVTLHGHAAWALGAGFSNWKKQAETRGYGVIALQWWFGSGDATTDYYTPPQVYTAVSDACKALNVRTRSVLFHGFSRASACSYAVTAVACASGENYFLLTFSDAGGAAEDYPPNIDIANGLFGTQPLAGMHWAMYAGGQDPDPEKSGEPAMKSAKKWVEQYGGRVELFIDDPDGAHGGFHTKTENYDALFSLFAKLLDGYDDHGSAPLNMIPTAGKGKFKVNFKKPNKDSFKLKADLGSLPLPFDGASTGSVFDASVRIGPVGSGSAFILTLNTKGTTTSKNDAKVKVNLMTHSATIKVSKACLMSALGLRSEQALSDQPLVVSVELKISGLGAECAPTFTVTATAGKSAKGKF